MASRRSPEIIAKCAQVTVAEFPIQSKIVFLYLIYL